MTDLHSVPTPLDARSTNLRDGVENVYAAGAAMMDRIRETSEGLGGALNTALIPVVDVPALRDEPTSTTAEPERFTARVHVATDPTVPAIYVGGVVSWREYSSRLDLYGIVDGQRERLVSFAPHAWVWVERVTDDTDGIDA
ncbi:hypothetical protein [Isoptericola sp. QY 916]|uniref:hypothetical protein n=1 Tax=Isoptericola sp. QY 916 TaxID=2782570 RepID=UPI003D2F9CC6|nr:hypothetical protein [Isoptericola sp. QY 916]